MIDVGVASISLLVVKELQFLCKIVIISELSKGSKLADNSSSVFCSLPKKVCEQSAQESGDFVFSLFLVIAVSLLKISPTFVDRILCNGNMKC